MRWLFFRRSTLKSYRLSLPHSAVFESSLHILCYCEVPNTFSLWIDILMDEMGIDAVTLSAWCHGLLVSLNATQSVSKAIRWRSDRFAAACASLWYLQVSGSGYEQLCCITRLSQHFVILHRSIVHLFAETYFVPIKLDALQMVTIANHCWLTTYNSNPLWQESK